MKTLELKRNGSISGAKNLSVTNKVLNLNHIMGRWQRDTVQAKYKVKGLLKKHISIDFNNKSTPSLVSNKSFALPKIELPSHKVHNASLVSTKPSNTQPKTPLRTDVKEQLMNEIKEKFYMNRSKSIGKVVFTTKTRCYLTNVTLELT